MGCTNSREESTYVPNQVSRSLPSRDSVYRDRRYHVFWGSRMYAGCLQKLPNALASAGLTHLNLIVGIDFSRTNLQTGDTLNPYENAMSIIRRVWSKFYHGRSIHCYGFGNASMLDHDVFSFNINERFCNGFEEVLTRYKEIVPHIRVSGPISLAPIIEMASTETMQIGGQYNVLLIIADTQSFAIEQSHRRKILSGQL